MWPAMPVFPTTCGSGSPRFFLHAPDAGARERGPGALGERGALGLRAGMGTQGSRNLGSGLVPWGVQAAALQAIARSLARSPVLLGLVGRLEEVDRAALRVNRSKVGDAPNVCSAQEQGAGTRRAGGAALLGRCREQLPPSSEAALQGAAHTSAHRCARLRRSCRRRAARALRAPSC